MKTLVKEPLLYFLAAGLCLFILFDVLSPSDQGDADSQTIVVDRDALLTFIQYRTKAFDPQSAAARLDALSDEGRAQLIEEYVREEALHREALALELGRDDYVIRRRLVQTLQFIAQGFPDGAEELDDARIRRFFEEHRQDYFVAPSVTFTHVFFDAERRGRDQARSAAMATLDRLNQAGVSFSNAPQYGDRFLYQLNYVERALDYVESQFGASMAKAILNLEPDPTKWRGPFESAYGVHLVMVTGNEPGRYPSLNEVRSRVAEDLRRTAAREREEVIVRGIVDSYRVEVVDAEIGARDAVLANR